MARLVAALDVFAATEESVSVVFDGQPVVLEAAHVSVRFAPGGPNAADEAIKGEVLADPEPGSLTVVTSDRALERDVRAAGASVLGAGAFRRRLDEHG